ncbi:MAG: ribosome silencing factor, partial [Pirellulaceae bacterium]|nr:ribosome silencing factor [Pirellulaceae bacterium]
GRQLRAVAEEIEQALESEFGETKLSLAGKDDGHWIILDFGTIVIHLFDEETRAFYSLENLWAEATKVDLSQVVSPQSLAKSLDD